MVPLSTIDATDVASIVIDQDTILGALLTVFLVCVIAIPLYELLTSHASGHRTNEWEAIFDAEAIIMVYAIVKIALVAYAGANFQWTPLTAAYLIIELITVAIVVALRVRWQRANKRWQELVKGPVPPTSR